MLAEEQSVAVWAGSRARRDIAGTLATHPAAAWGLAGLFVIAGLVAIHAHTFLNNEGILTWIFAGLTSESPLDMLFLFKARPPISLLYAPVAALGLTPFLWGHVVLAAFAMPLTASLARRFDHESPNLAAALVACSPVYFAGAAAGVQNTDAALGLVVVAWLLARKRPVAAGCLLSFVVLGRVETVIFGVAFALYALRTPDARRFLVAACVIPVIYVLLGALYHRDLLWVLHHPSSVWANPAFDPARRARFGGTLGDVVTALLALTPAAGVLMWTSLRGGGLERILVLAAITFVIVLRLLPFTQLLWVDVNPRYILPAQPFIALAASRAFTGWGRNRGRTLAAGALLLGVSALLSVEIDQATRGLLWAAAGAGMAAAGLSFWSKRAAAMVLIAVCVAEAWPLFPTTRLFFGLQAKQVEESARWITVDVPPGSVVVTDDHLLPIWLADRVPALNVELRHVVQPDMQYEASALMDPSTPQFRRFFGTSRFFYARWIFPEDIAALRGDVFFVIRTDTPHYTDLLSEPPFDRVKWLVEGDRWIGGRLIRDAAAPTGGGGGR